MHRQRGQVEIGIKPEDLASLAHARPDGPNDFGKFGQFARFERADAQIDFARLVERRCEVALHDLRPRNQAMRAGERIGDAIGDTTLANHYQNLRCLQAGGLIHEPDKVPQRRPIRVQLRHPRDSPKQPTIDPLCERIERAAGRDCIGRVRTVSHRDVGDDGGS